MSRYDKEKEEQLYIEWKNDTITHLPFEMWLYEKGRADERSHIVKILFGIDRQVAELVKEILNNEKSYK